MKEFIMIFDGDVNDVQFFVVVLTIVLAALNCMITGRPIMGFGSTLYRIAFILVAIAAGAVFINFYDQGLEARPPGVLYMAATDVMMIARLYAVRIDRRSLLLSPDTVEDAKSVESVSRRAPLCRARRFWDWLTH